jgi:hypothetical protein
LRLKTLAEIATIAALVLVALQYFKLEPNTLDELSGDLKEIASNDVGKISLKFDLQKYEDSQSIAFTMYQAGLLDPYDSGKSESLKNASMAALDEGDYALAIIAAKEIPYDSVKSSTLEHVAIESLKNRETMRFSVLAADLIPYSSTKNSVVEKISGVYEHVKNGGALETYATVSEKPVTELDKYKVVFKFADSRSFMDLDEKSAKKFTDDWFKSRSYEEFEVFREVFKFADSRSFMNMNEKDATDFALKWLEKYGLDDFQVFREAYTFAASGSFMDMEHEEALEFALGKLDEDKKLTINSTRTPNSSLRSESVAGE